MKRLKLYRGLKSNDFVDFDKTLKKECKEIMRPVVELRANGIMDYPEHFNENIIKFHKLQSLQFQQFTDDPKTARRYKKDAGSIMVQISVPLDDLFKYFVIETQNYSKRRERFELVYLVLSRDLIENKIEWEFEVV